MTEKDLRTFIRDTTRRNERVTQDLIRGHARHTEAIVSHLDDQRSVLQAQTEALREMRAEIADQRKQIQANTQAVLSVLDRLN